MRSARNVEAGGGMVLAGEECGHRISLEMFSYFELDF